MDEAKGRAAGLAPRAGGFYRHFPGKVDLAVEIGETSIIETRGPGAPESGLTDKLMIDEWATFWAGSLDRTHAL